MATNPSWTGDETTYAELAAELYRLLPALYRVQDEDPEGRGDLQTFLAVLAGPLAEVQQSIRELHADLFIDTAGDAALPLLAKMVATTLVFPDADRNRIDVRNTVRWRRRKGTPAMLQEMAEELSSRQAPLIEGWKLCQVAQDPDLQRLARVLPDLRPRLIAESSSGPWDGPYHLIDPRAPTRVTGRAHPRHLAWYVHVTALFPLTEATAAWMGRGPEPVVAGAVLGDDPDWRYAFHPTGDDWPLRLRRSAALPGVKSDRMGEARFGADPLAWFGKDGAFLVRICGLSAAALAVEPPTRSATNVPASLTLAAGSVAAHVLAWSGDRMLRPVRVTLEVAPRIDTPPRADLTLVAPVVTLLVTEAGPGVPSPTPVVAGVDDLVLLRVAPDTGANAWFGGATIAFVGGTPTAARTSGDGALAREGYLDGALVITIPPGWVTSSTRYYVAADGSLIQADDGASSFPLRPGPPATLNLDHLVYTGLGPAWPPQDTSASAVGVDDPLPALACGPVVMHGGRVLVDPGSGWTHLVDPTVECSLVFAVRSAGGGAIDVVPVCRLRWTAGDPAGAIWISTTGPVDGAAEADLAARVADVAALLVASDPDEPMLAVRFEASVAGLRICPAEVAWRSASGATLLIHLPELPTSPTAVGDDFATDLTRWVEASETVLVGADGSTWPTSGGYLRMSQGQVAPLAGDVPLLRRQVRGRRLCAWRSEVPPGAMLAGTPPRTLDVDVLHGLFAFAEAPQPWSPPAGGTLTPPSNVTIDEEDARTAHIGCLPEAREPVLDLRQDDPTRVVSRSGGLPAALSAALVASFAAMTATFHRTVGAALAAATGATEVIQLVDSSVWVGESLTFPASGGDLTIQATERCRPLVRLVGPTVPGAGIYTSLTLRGVHFADADVVLPMATTITLQYCTIARGTRLHVTLTQGGTATFIGCLLGEVEVTGEGTVSFLACVLDGPAALTAAACTVTMDAVTVRGATDVFVLHASECILDGPLTITNRFEGCVRYSRVPAGAKLPRHYRCAVGTIVRFVSTEATAAAYVRLSEACDAAVRQGAEDGGEMGAFHDTHWGPIYLALQERLRDSTPAGLRAGFIRCD